MFTYTHKNEVTSKREGFDREQRWDEDSDDADVFQKYWDEDIEAKEMAAMELLGTKIGRRTIGRNMSRRRLWRETWMNAPGKTTNGPKIFYTS